MYRSRNARVLELAALVLPVAPRVSATALPSPPRTAGLNDALNLLGAGKLDETPAILPPLATGRTVDADVLSKSDSQRPVRRGSPWYRRARATPCRTKPSAPCEPC